ncbi:MAG: ABC transporter permease [Parvibaculaceae bacterium]
MSVVSAPAPRIGRWTLAGLRELTLMLLIAALVIAMSVLSPHFLSLANFRAMAVGLVPTAIIAVGMTILLVSGNFDLSVGSVLALSSTVLALLVAGGVPIALAVATTLAVGLLIGLANGVIVTAIGVNPLVATLGTMSIARGIALVLTEGFSIANLPAAFGWAGKSEIMALPVMFWIMVGIVAVGDLAMRHLAFLRQAYFIGANERAARLSGMPVARVKCAAFMITAGLAAIAGMLLASRLMSGTPTAGNALELQVLAAAVIGGASLRGGEGTVLGAILGVVFVALVNNAMTMLAVSIYWQMIVTGLVLVAAVAVDMLVKRRRE